MRCILRVAQGAVAFLHSTNQHKPLLPQQLVLSQHESLNSQSPLPETKSVDVNISESTISQAMTGGNLIGQVGRQESRKRI